MARCFQLTSEVLSDALVAAASPCSRLRTIALSHLDLSSWPPQSSAHDPSEPEGDPVQRSRSLLTVSLRNSFPPGGRLQVLSAHASY